MAALATPPPPITYELALQSAAAQHHPFSVAQLSLLEKLNRTDTKHLTRRPLLVIPSRWDLDELAYSPLPAHRAAWAGEDQFLSVDLALQAFGAYEHGHLVRWGPISSGSKTSPTPSGTYHLNWRSRGRHSTVDPDWFMKWYFNFANFRGLSFHAYALPGYPASHACVRLLSRDARWLYDWGNGWTLDESGTAVLSPGTPVSIVGAYDFDAPPPWLAVASDT